MRGHKALLCDWTGKLGENYSSKNAFVWLKLQAKHKIKSWIWFYICKNEMYSSDAVDLELTISNYIIKKYLVKKKEHANNYTGILSGYCFRNDVISLRMYWVRS